MDTESGKEGNELGDLSNTETVVLENMYRAWSLFLTWTLSQTFPLQIQLQLLQGKIYCWDFSVELFEIQIREIDDDLNKYG